MATLRLFAAAREAAGTAVETINAETVGAALADACTRHGEAFGAVLAQSKVWLNGEPASLDAAIADGDEVAVLPPVSGGSESVAPGRPG